MKIPKTLKIGGFIWKIVYNQDVNTGSATFGQTHYRTQKLFIAPESSQQKQEQALIHEILHAIFWQNALTETFKNEQEEQIVASLSMGLYQVLKDNHLLR